METPLSRMRSRRRHDGHLCAVGEDGAQLLGEEKEIKTGRRERKDMSSFNHVCQPGKFQADTTQMKVKSTVGITVEHPRRTVTAGIKEGNNELLLYSPLLCECTARRLFH